MPDPLISHAIMAHPNRAHFVADYLLPRMPGATVVWDEHQDRWDTGRRSMLAYHPGATWHVVTQDDAILCDEYLASVEAALSSLPPDGPACFYIGAVRPRATYFEAMMKLARERGSHWIRGEGPWWGPSVAVPVAMIDAMVAWGDGPRGRPIANYDMRMARYFGSKAIECYYAVPSLVSHRTGDENPSLVPGRSNSDVRVAIDFIGADRSGAGIEWATEPVLYNELYRPRNRRYLLRAGIPAQ